MAFHVNIRRFCTNLLFHFNYINNNLKIQYYKINETTTKSYDKLLQNTLAVYLKHFLVLVK